jgi:hypothetical protein
LITALRSLPTADRIASSKTFGERHESSSGAIFTLRRTALIIVNHSRRKADNPLVNVEWQWIDVDFGKASLISEVTPVILASKIEGCTPRKIFQ